MRIVFGKIDCFGDYHVGFGKHLAGIGGSRTDEISPGPAQFHGDPRKNTVPLPVGFLAPPVRVSFGRGNRAVDILAVGQG